MHNRCATIPRWTRLHRCRAGLHPGATPPCLAQTRPCHTNPYLSWTLLISTQPEQKKTKLYRNSTLLYRDPTSLRFTIGKHCDARAEQYLALRIHCRTSLRPCRTARSRNLAICYVAVTRPYLTLPLDYETTPMLRLSSLRLCNFFPRE